MEHFNQSIWVKSLATAIFYLYRTVGREQVEQHDEEVNEEKDTEKSDW